MDILKTCPSQPQRWVCTNRNTLCLGVLTIVLLLSTIVLSVKLHHDDNAAHAPHRNHKENTMENFRLSKEVKPVNYKLKLAPNLENKTYNGFIRITIEVNTSTGMIQLHSKDLNINSVTLENDTMKNIAIKSNKIKKDLELLEVYLVSAISTGNYYLNIDYNGNMDKKIIGLYASSLKNGR